jgi:hypothetical protein
MQRHFSNRGEALSEVTAARVLTGRKRSAQSAFAAPAGRRAKPGQWFSQPAETTPRPKKKQPSRNIDVTPLL